MDSITPMGVSTIKNNIFKRESKSFDYDVLTKMPNRVMNIVYSFTNDSGENKGTITLTIPENSTGLQIRDFIVSEINKELSAPPKQAIERPE